jgi:hypothetical protein
MQRIMAGDYTFWHWWSRLFWLVIGLNSKFKLLKSFLWKYYDDFDTNGSFETIVATENRELLSI